MRRQRRAACNRVFAFPVRADAERGTAAATVLPLLTKGKVFMARQGWRGVSVVFARAAAATSNWWSRLSREGWEAEPPPGRPPLYYDPFVRQLAHFGRYIKGCGGGVIAEPLRAIGALRERYGDTGLCDRCVALLFDQDAGAEYPEGVDRTALGIVYRLGDEATLRRLLATRRRLLEQACELPGPDAAARQRRTLESCGSLIAGMCLRLGHAPPDGVPVITEQDTFYLLD